MSNLPQLVTSVMPIPGLQAVMILLGIGVGIWAGVTGRVTRPFVLGVLVPLSLALSPHVWSHDLILLFPAFFAAAVAGFERARDLTSALLMTQFLISAALFWSHVSNEVYLALLPVVMLALAPLTLARLARGTEASTL
jgi:uncharacterized membrane protein SpoIIM required for sporulation